MNANDIYQIVVCHEKQLKPCPCCGNKAVLEEMQTRKGWEAVVSCTGCLLNMPTITYDELETAVLIVVKAWNRRADNA